jgi:hypothetical protein
MVASILRRYGLRITGSFLSFSLSHSLSHPRFLFLSLSLFLSFTRTFCFQPPDLQNRSQRILSLNGFIKMNCDRFIQQSEE